MWGSRKGLKTNRYVISGELFNYNTFIQILNRDEKIQKLLEDISKQVEDYQALQHTKTALDMEIAVYKRLLESEEDRLGIEKGSLYHHNIKHISDSLRLLFQIPTNQILLMFATLIGKNKNYLQRN